ncbi:MAG: murein biosynthesis integral membrane protein MurJ [Chloroflexi bacterium]|nr:murein biosynthesis integral membrane protein MurJ [Chloroflexota bacterium]
MTLHAIPSPRPRLLHAATVVMLFFVASRVLGLGRDIVISYQFGTSRTLDAYFAAFNIPDLIFNVIAGGALGSAFIPTFAAALASGDPRRAWRLASAVLNLALIVLTAIAAILALFAPQVVAATVAQGFAPDDQALTASLMRWMLVTPIVFGLSGIVMGILNSHQHFVLPAFAPVVYNAAIIAGAIFLAPTMGVYGLTFGVVAGALLHLLVQVPWLVRRRMHYTPTVGLYDADVREVGRLMLPRTLGLAAVQINFLVNTILASGLPAGSIAALGYAWRVMLLPEGIVALSFATAVFPTLSEQVARKALDDFRETFSNVFRVTLYLTVPAAVGLLVLGAPLVALLFQRGEFDARSTAETAWALRFYAVGLFAHSGLEIITRAFYAMHDTRTPVTIGVAAMLLNIVLSVTLIAPLSHGGLALANSVATILEMLALLYLLRQRIGQAGDKRLFASVARIGAAAMVMALAMAPFADSSSIMISIVGAAIGGAAYFAVTIALRSEEIQFVLRRARGTDL